LYKGLGYSVFRVVKDYNNDDPTDETKDSEDGWDMRKQLKRDVHGKHVRSDGEKYMVSPEDVW
jgi:N-terminal acetyltransferase B complex catalytic subunit